MLILYIWTCEIPINRASFQLSVSPSTLSFWNNRFREYMNYFYYIKNNEPIGGIGQIVEIDGALLKKRKYNRGRIL